jgi:hypothetical protein
VPGRTKSWSSNIKKSCMNSRKSRKSTVGEHLWNTLPSPKTSTVLMNLSNSTTPCVAYPNSSIRTLNPLLWSCQTVLVYDRSYQWPRCQFLLIKLLEYAYLFPSLQYLLRCHAMSYHMSYPYVTFLLGVPSRTCSNFFGLTKLTSSINWNFQPSVQ